MRLPEDGPETPENLQEFDEADKIVNAVPVIGPIITTLFIDPFKDIAKAFDKKKLDAAKPYPTAAQVFSPGI